MLVDHLTDFIIIISTAPIKVKSWESACSQAFSQNKIDKHVRSELGPGQDRMGHHTNSEMAIVDGE